MSPTCSSPEAPSVVATSRCASRWAPVEAAIVRQLLTESSVLAFAGAALGLALAWWTRGLLLALHPFGRPQVGLDLPIDAKGPHLHGRRRP